MPKSMMLGVVAFFIICWPLAAKSHDVSKASLFKELANTEGDARWHIVYDIRDKWNPDGDGQYIPLIRSLLSDRSGSTISNTVADEAAKILVQNAEHVLQSIPELLDLAKEEGFSSWPQDSAPLALLSVPRHRIEAHIAETSTERLALYRERSIAILEAESRTYVAMEAACRTISFIPNVGASAIQLLNRLNQRFDFDKLDNHYHRRMLVRCRLAETIHRDNLVSGDDAYETLMQKARLDVAKESVRWICRRDIQQSDTVRLKICVERLAAAAVRISID